MSTKLVMKSMQCPISTLRWINENLVTGADDGVQIHDCTLCGRVEMQGRSTALQGAICQHHYCTMNRCADGTGSAYCVPFTPSSLCYASNIKPQPSALAAQVLLQSSNV
jgi:hypothetical protein